MSPDDPNDKGAKKPRQQRTPGRPQLVPSDVDETRVPRIAPSAPPPSQGSGGQPPILSTLLIVAGILVLVSFVLLNARSGSNHTVTPGVPGAGNPFNYGQPPTQTTPPSTEPPKHPLPPGVIWHHTISTDINTSFNIDNYPISNEPSGFEVTDSSAPHESLDTVGGTKEVEWTATRQPLLSDCRAALAATAGSGPIELLHVGRWMCVETSARNIGRLRFLGAHANTYSFDVTVYRL